jgi:hypothetical protein
VCGAGANSPDTLKLQQSQRPIDAASAKAPKHLCNASVGFGCTGKGSAANFAQLSKIGSPNPETVDE